MNFRKRQTWTAPGLLELSSHPITEESETSYRLIFQSSITSWYIEATPSLFETFIRVPIMDGGYPKALALLARSVHQGPALSVQRKLRNKRKCGSCEFLQSSRPLDLGVQIQACIDGQCDLRVRKKLTPLCCRVRADGV